MGDFRCVTCGKTTNSRHELEHHLKTHSEIRDVICHLCAKGFKHNEALRAHMRTHGEKTIPCDLCDQKFATRGTFREDE